MVWKILIYCCMISAFRQFRRMNEMEHNSGNERTNIASSSFNTSPHAFYNPNDLPITLRSLAVPLQVYNPLNNAILFPWSYITNPDISILQSNPRITFSSLEEARKHKNPSIQGNQKDTSASASAPQCKAKNHKKTAKKLAVPSFLPPSTFINADIPTNPIDIEKMLDGVKKEIEERLKLVETSQIILEISETELKISKDSLAAVNARKEALKRSNAHYTRGPNKQRTPEFVELVKDTAHWNRVVRASGPAISVRNAKLSIKNNLEQIEQLRKKIDDLNKALVV
ncbi:hypothetical protein ENBRE01_1551 [Enteropsectra breve]|nr:hypothetical protein ENBRE01_1551 [Enteropsectra breve]